MSPKIWSLVLQLGSCSPEIGRLKSQEITSVQVPLQKLNHLPLPLRQRVPVESRSRLTNYPAAVRTAWGVAGILDCLINSNPAEARARAALMLLQADQVALDKGSWTLASEASLELAPPFHSFASHAAVDASDQPLSRLFEPRRAEIMLHHLRDTEDYVERKRKLGAKGNRTPSEEESQPGPKPGAKPKPKP